LRVLGLIIFILVVFGALFALFGELIYSLLGGNSEWLSLALPTGRRLILFLRSVGLAASVSVAGVLLGVLAGTVLWRWHSGIGAKLKWLVLVLAPVPPYIHALAWSTFVFKLNSFLAIAGLPDLQLQGFAGSWWVQLMSFTPIAVGLAMIGLKSVEPMLMESARIMRSDISSFIKVIVPLAAPALAAGGGILFLLSLMDYSVPALLDVNVYTMEIFTEFSASNEPARALLSSLPLLVIAIIVIYISQSALKNAAQTHSWGIPSLKVQIRWPKWFIILQWITIAMLIAHIIVPVITLIAITGSWQSMVSSVTLARSEILFTFWIAILSAVICIPIALTVAAELVSSKRWAWIWWLLVLAPLAIPSPLIGIGLITIWNHSFVIDVYGSGFMPVLAAIARFAPFAAIVMVAQLRRIDPLLIDAGRIIQRNSIQTWLRIWLLMLLPGLLAAGGIAFALTTGELGATLLVAPPGQATLTMRIYNFLHYGATDTVAGLCLIMALFSVVAGTFAVLALAGWSKLYPGRTNI
jgi:iron(III) transport system permease protein